MNHLTPDQAAKLNADIRVRWELQHTMAEHSKPVIEAELGLDHTTIWHIEKGAIDLRPGTRITAAVAKQVRDRRNIWYLASERMQEYTQPALAKKYGVTVSSICRRIKALREVESGRREWRHAA